jgi:hypothetical protein
LRWTKTPPHTAKSCGPDAATLASSWRRCFCIAPATVTTKPAHRGELEGNRKKHRAGKAGSIRMYLWLLRSCAFYFRTRGYGCVWRPAFPAPSRKGGTKVFSRTRANVVAGMPKLVVCEPTGPRECAAEGRLVKQSGPRKYTGLLRRAAPRNDEARRWLFDN